MQVFVSVRKHFEFQTNFYQIDMPIYRGPESSSKFQDPSSTQPELYSLGRASFTKNRQMNATDNIRKNNREKQIQTLHVEFEDLKKKIKYVETRNEKIIEKIHKQCDFKKKNSPYTFDLSNENKPIVYYEKKQPPFHSSTQMGRANLSSSVDESHQSGESQFEYRQRKPFSSSKKKGSIESRDSKAFNPNLNDFSQSMEYQRSMMPQLQMKKNHSQMAKGNIRNSTPKRRDHQQISESELEERNTIQSNSRNSHKVISQESYQREEIQFPLAIQTHQHLRNSQQNKFNISGSETHMAMSQIARQRDEDLQHESREGSTKSSMEVFKMEEALKLEKEKIAYLQSQLREKQIEIFNFKSLHEKTIYRQRYVSQQIGQYFQDFMEGVVRKGMMDIEKILKKNERKIKNLALTVKDCHQEQTSSRVIRENRLRRSNSRSKKDMSPSHNTSLSSVIGPHSQSGKQSSKLPKPISSQQNLDRHHEESSRSVSRSKIKGIDDNKMETEFEQMTKKYEEMLNAKSVDISKLQSENTKLKKKCLKLQQDLEEKDRQIMEVTTKKQELQKLMSETDLQQPIVRQIQKQLPMFPRKKTSASNESNLLEDIYNSAHEDADRLQAKYELQYLHAKREIQEKQSTIRELSKKLKKIENSQNGKNTSSSRISEKMKKDIEEELENQIMQRVEQKYGLRLKTKEKEVTQISNKCHKLEKQLIQKECVISSQENKIKKYEVSVGINTAKIEELEKILKEGNGQKTQRSERGSQRLQMLLLENSICEDDAKGDMSGRSSRKSKQISLNDLDVLEEKLHQKECESLELTKNMKILETQVINLETTLSLIEDEKRELKERNSKLLEKVQSFENNLESMERNSNYSIGFEEIAENSFSEAGKSEASKKKSKDKNRENVLYLSDVYQKQNHDSFGLSAENQESKKRLQEEIQKLKEKNQEIFQGMNTLKADHLQISRQKIGVEKENEYLVESLKERERRYEKLKKQFEESKIRINWLNQEIKTKSSELEQEKEENNKKIQELEKQWHEFEEEIIKNNNIHPETHQELDRSEVLKSSRHNISESSILLSSSLHNKNSQYLQEQNEYLSVKLKEAEAQIEIHNRMEQKVLEEYKLNVEKLKIQIKDKTKEIELLKGQLREANDKNKKAELLYESRLHKSRARAESISSSNFNRDEMQASDRKAQSLVNRSIFSENGEAIEEEDEQNSDHNPFLRILELENELKESKEINLRLQEMDEEIFKQIRIKEDEKGELMKVIEQKNFRIQEMEQIIELKEAANMMSHFGGSHISSSNQRSSSNTQKTQPNLHHLSNPSQRESMKSNSSLRYSGITNLKHTESMMRDGDEPLDVELSEAGSEYFDKSYVTNISQIFEKDDFPYQKVQLKRKEQIRLFQKTASYIKSLKDSINQKNRHIKLLEKKIDCLRHSHMPHISSVNSEGKHEVASSSFKNASHIYNEDPDADFDTVFKDYESVQLERRGLSYSKKYKNLDHEWKLAIEENNVLASQIEALQEELDKAEEHEKTIINIKELYKTEINTLMAQVKHYEKEIQKEKKKLEDSEAVHNIETLKQLFIKVIECVTAIEEQKTKKKREEKRRELEEFFKVFASMSGMENLRKEQMIASIRKISVVSKGPGSHRRDSGSGHKQER